MPYSVMAQHFFRRIFGFFARVFAEMWSYLPTPRGKVCRVPEILAGLTEQPENLAEENFPPARKIDV
ncbi:MAG TPA: hypothetical protein VMO78_10915 [Rhizomicrobium sp.]|nr:hypothetical protein [Rhizomicrobium sp.]